MGTDGTDDNRLYPYRNVSNNGNRNRVKGSWSV